MAKLVLSMDGLVLKELTLEQGRLTIGRKSVNDIQIDNMAISGVHAAIVTILDDSFLEDLDSTNGTLVNGQAVRRHVLAHGDEVELGKYKLKYLKATPSSPDVIAAPEKKPEIPIEPSERIPEPHLSDAASSMPLGVIKLLNGANTGKELSLAKTTTTLGKPGVQIATITRSMAGYKVNHVEGGRYPLINGSPIETSALLVSGDQLEIAGIRMLFTLTENV